MSFPRSLRPSPHPDANEVKGSAFRNSARSAPNPSSVPRGKCNRTARTTAVRRRSGEGSSTGRRGAPWTSPAWGLRTSTGWWRRGSSGTSPIFICLPGGGNGSSKSTGGGKRAGATLLVDPYGSIDGLMRASRDELEQIDQVGPRIAESITSFFALAANRSLVDRLRKAGLNLAESAAEKKKNGIFSGRTFVVTGALSGRSRQEVKTLIENLGGRVAS